MPNFSIYLYICLFLFLTDVLLPLSSPSLSYRLTLARFFSAIKIYAQPCTRCVHIAFRLARCSFCAELRIHLKRVYTDTNAHVYKYVERCTHMCREVSLSLFRSRAACFSRLALSLTSLFVSAARSGRISPSSSLENLRRGNARQRDHR